MMRLLRFLCVKNTSLVAEVDHHVTHAGNRDAFAARSAAREVFLKLVE